MIQKTAVVESETELVSMLMRLKSDLAYLNARTKFVQVLLSRFDCEDAKKIVSVLRAAAPDLQIVGMSLFGDPLVALNDRPSIRCNFCFFNESDAHVFCYDALTVSEQDMVRAFRADLAPVQDAKGVLVLAGGVTFGMSRFMSGAAEGHDDIPFFGTVSHINVQDVGRMEPYVFASEFITRGVVAVVFSGKNLSFFTESLFSWKPIGKAMAVSSERAEGLPAGDTLVRTIDGQPATSVYKTYLDVDPDLRFTTNICEFPIVVERNGYLLPRVPCGYTEDGGICTMGDILDGEKIRFSYGKASEILALSKEASVRISQFVPEAMFLYVCGNRAIFLKERAQEEIGYFCEVSPELLFAYGFSELYRFRGQGGVLNSQLVVVGMREGSAADMKRSVESLSFYGISFDAPPATDDRASSGPLSVLQGKAESPRPIAERLVTFLEATTRELYKMTEAANAASRAKSAFLSSMSHEIRSPINAVLGLDEMILRESSEERIKGYAHDIQSSGRTLLSLVNDILDFSKIEAGKMEILDGDYDLRSTITDLANMIEIRARSKGLDFIVRVDEDIPHLLRGDETRIKQCVLNVLTNAVKYTHSGSVTLSVGGKKNDGGILLSFRVVDTGIGIKPEDLGKLSRPFERIEEDRNRSIEGTGLGMSIVNGLLSQMGSHLEVSSVYGKGSDFSFSVAQEVRDWERIGSRETAENALRREAASYEESFQAPHARILVVDDTPVNLTVVRGLLKNLRMEIDVAESGEEALRLVCGAKYHLLLVDHLMPRMDGIEFLSQARTLPSSRNRETPAVVLTANAVGGAREHYLSAGFDGYLSKPLEPRKLEETIASFLPKELVLHAGDEGFVPHQNPPQDGTERRRDADGIEGLFLDVFALQASHALRNCGSKDVFLDAVRTFHDAIPGKALEIERYAESADWRSFTVQVHALKSSARLIGADGLSSLAGELERLGNKAASSDADAVSLVLQKLPALLSLYRSYEARLSPLCPQKAEGAREEISREKLGDALLAVKEFLSAFDFDSADMVVQELDGFSMPADFAGTYARLKERIRAVDREGALALL